jgi:hypothetical protein
MTPFGIAHVTVASGVPHHCRWVNLSGGLQFPMFSKMMLFQMSISR